MAFNLFPFTNLHNLNTDWILKTIKECKAAVDTSLAAVQEALTNAVLYTSQSKEAMQRKIACGNIHAVSYDASGLTNDESLQACNNITAVSYIEQTLTSTQQAQARTNIGALSSSDIPSVTGVVSYEEAQTLTDGQKAQARTNIGAASTAGLATLADNVNSSINTIQGDLAKCVKITPQTLSSSQQAQARANIGAISSSEIPASTTVLDVYVAPDELETGYECDHTAAQIEAAVDAGRPVRMTLTLIGGSTAYQILPVLNYTSTTLTSITADLFIPVDASNLGSCLIYHLAITPGSPDTVAVTDGSGKLVPAPNGILDAGKALVVNNLGNPAWSNIGPNVVLDTSSTTPTIASAADNTIYKFTQDLTSLSVTAGSGSYMICFHSGSTATTTSFPVSILGLDDFVPETDTYYEVNIMDGRAVWMGWADPEVE